VDTARLARLEHDNLIAALSVAVAQAPGARVERTRGVSLIASGLPLLLFNQVLVDDDDAPDDAIAEAVAVVRDRGDHFVVNLRVGLDDRRRPLMERLDLVRLGDRPWMPGMVLHPLPAAGSVPPAPGHEIRVVTDGPGIEDLIATSAAGFGVDRAIFDAIVTEALVARPDVTLYVGYTDGVPVTTGLSARTGRTIGIYTIATIEAARRRGYGAAMTMRIVDDGLAAGCDVSVLQASDMGLPIYERLGFRTVVQYDGFVDPP
jgi:GNAT superfamily N-acetyltransferase